MKATTRPLFRAAASSMRSVQQQPRALFSSTAAQKKLPGGTPGETSDPSEQKTPLGPYYESMLHAPQPIPKVKPEQPPQSSPNAPPKSTSSSKAAAEKKDTQAAKKTTEAGGLPTDPDPVPPPPSPPTPPSSSDSSSSSSSEPNPLQSAFTFGTKLGGPANEAARAERLKALRISKGTRIAGILVPPKPEEPDNCCMSGCVNCVWDRFRDDMEEWAALSKQAEAALQAQRGQGDVSELGKISAVKGMPSLRKTEAQEAAPATAASSSDTMSMDDDGGGSDANWVDPLAGTKPAGDAKIAKDFWDDELYKNLPVGIREFMKQEKRLKEKHAREGTSGG